MKNLFGLLFILFIVLYLLNLLYEFVISLFSWELVLILLLIVLVVLIKHMFPLSEEQVKQVAKKEREKMINHYYTFSNNEWNDIEEDFSKPLNPGGDFYNLDLSLYSFPAFASYLLKDKKHQWILVAYEKDKRIICFWANKGSDKYTVQLYIPDNTIVNKAVKIGATSLLLFQNHPVSAGENRIERIRPTADEHDLAHNKASLFNRYNINFLSFICATGSFSRYYMKCTSLFYSEEQYIKRIDKLNGYSIYCNLKLHAMRYF